MTRLASRTALSLVFALSASLAACGGADENITVTSVSDDSCVFDCADEFDAGDQGEAATCVDVSVSFEANEATVVLLIDQSGSMDQDYDGTDRWGALYDALMDPSDGVVASLESEVRLGLALYTSYDGFDGPTCPVVTEVDAAFDAAVRGLEDLLSGDADSPLLRRYLERVFAAEAAS